MDATSGNPDSSEGFPGENFPSKKLQSRKAKMTRLVDQMARISNPAFRLAEG